MHGFSSCELIVFTNPSSSCLCCAREKPPTLVFIATMPAHSKMMKRPAAAQQEGRPMKRPAASASLKDSILDLQAKAEKKDWDDEQSAGSDNEAGSSAEAKRDKGKGQKFAAMKLAGSLPAYVLDLYNNEATKKESPRSFRTTIINELFHKQSSGRYVLRDDAPLFQEAKRCYERKYGIDGRESYTKLVMRGMFFQNSAEAT